MASNGFYQWQISKIYNLSQYKTMSVTSYNYLPDSYLPRLYITG